MKPDNNPRLYLTKPPPLKAQHKLRAGRRGGVLVKGEWAERRERERRGRAAACKAKDIGSG